MHPEYGCSFKSGSAGREACFLSADAEINRKVYRFDKYPFTNRGSSIGSLEKQCSFLYSYRRDLSW
jgi:hypothetical protein